MKNLLRAFVLGLVVIAAISCNKKTEDGTTITTEMDGSWTSPCKNDSPHSQRDTLTVSNGTLTYISKLYYGTTTCADANLGLTYTLVGTVIVTGASTSITGANEYEMTLSTFTATPSNSTYASSMNTDTTCDAADWSAGVAKSVFGSTDWQMQNLAAGTIIYDIFKVDLTATPNTLQLGDTCAAGGTTNTGSFCTPVVARPTAINSTTDDTFTRQ